MSEIKILEAYKKSIDLWDDCQEARQRIPAVAVFDNQVATVGMTEEAEASCKS